MPENFQPILEQVGRLTTINASINALGQAWAARLEAEKDDPVAIQAIADEMRAKLDETTQAVVANTPSDPNPPNNPFSAQKKKN